MIPFHDTYLKNTKLNLHLMVIDHYTLLALGMKL